MHGKGRTYAEYMLENNNESSRVNKHLAKIKEVILSRRAIAVEVNASIDNKCIAAHQFIATANKQLRVVDSATSSQQSNRIVLVAEEINA